MKKFPFQFTVNSISLASVLLFVYWTSEGGLRKEITYLFGKGITSGSTTTIIQHSGDLLYYYAVLLTGLIFITGLLYALSRFITKLAEVMPSVHNFLNLMFELIKELVIFGGIYAFLLHDDGRGLKNNQLILLPFWFLVTICLHVLGKGLTAVAPRKLNFSSAAFYLKTVTIGVMLAQSFGYAPFKLI